MQHPDPCQQQKPDWCLDSQDLRNWVYYYFERIGKLIVLDSGEGPKLSIEGELYVYREGEEDEFIGRLHNDGIIRNLEGEIIGRVTIDGNVVDTDGQLFVNQFSNLAEIEIRDESGDLGFINNRGIFFGHNEQRVTWLPAQDTCNLDKVRLVHLDGTPLKVEEYDRIRCFILLWHKMGWTIDETDKALIGLDEFSAGNGNGTSPTSDGECDYVGFEVFEDDCSSPSSEDDGGCEPADDVDCPDSYSFLGCL